METHIKMDHSDSGSARTGTEGESCTSSTSDKENKLDLPGDTQYQRGLSDRSTPGPSLTNITPIPERHIQQSPVYENFGQGTTSTVGLSLQGDERLSESADLKDFSNAFYQSLPSHNHRGLNSVLLAAAAAATEELVINYQNDNPLPHPSKFQIPASAAAQYYNPVASPSSFSDSSRSSPSPKLEIVEPTEDSSVYILPDYNTDSRFREPALINDSSSSVIIHVPYADGLTPSSSSSTSPVPSSPDIVDLPSIKEELSLPPRKRTKMILKSMEKDKMEDTNFRYNSVIHYAKASQIA